MTRKDYILIAEALRVQYARKLGKFETGTLSGGGSIVIDIAIELADSLKRDNPRFNTGHFLAVVRGEKELTSRPSRNGGR